MHFKVHICMSLTKIQIQHNSITQETSSWYPSLQSWLLPPQLLVVINLFSITTVISSSRISYKLNHLPYNLLRLVSFTQHCPWDTRMILHAKIIHSFLFLSGISLHRYTTVSPFIKRHLVLLQLLVIMNRVAINFCV